LDSRALSPASGPGPAIARRRSGRRSTITSGCSPPRPWTLASRVGLISPTLNAKVINLFLKQMSEELKPAVHAVLIWDGAGFHTAGKSTCRRTSRCCNCRPITGAQPDREPLALPAEPSLVEPVLPRLRRIIRRGNGGLAGRVSQRRTDQWERRKTLGAAAGTGRSSPPTGRVSPSPQRIPLQPRADRRHTTPIPIAPSTIPGRASPGRTMAA
jgi:hypothetical protein